MLGGGGQCRADPFSLDSSVSLCMLVGTSWRRAADALALLHQAPSPPLDSPPFMVVPHLVPDTKRQCREIIFMEHSDIWVHGHTFLAHTFPPPRFSTVPPPIFPVWSHCWQHCNLWREARHGRAHLWGSTGLWNSHLYPDTGDLQSCQASPPADLTYAQRHRSLAFLYCGNATKNSGQSHKWMHSGLDKRNQLGKTVGRREGRVLKN